MIKKLLYISPRDMRKNRSDAVHIMQSCAAFAEVGIEVDLLTPKVERREYKVEFSEIFNLYNVNQDFNIIEMPTRFLEDTDNKDSKFKFGVQKFKESVKFAFKNIKSFKYDLVYSKCFISSVPFLFFKNLGLINTIFVFETPYVKDTWLHNFIVNNSDYIVLGSAYLKKKLSLNEKIGCKIIKPPRRYFLNESDNKFDKIKLRKEFGFKEELKYILYAGKVHAKSKEVNYLIQAAKELPQYQFVIVGVNEDSKRYCKSFNLPNLILFPFQTIDKYENIIRSADVLVAYYADNEYNRYYLGPGKAGSYFKSKNPVIFSDLPSLRDRYTDDMVYFVVPDDLELLIDKIKYIVQNPVLNEQKTLNAYNHILENTFVKSTEKVLEEIERREQEK